MQGAPPPPARICPSLPKVLNTASIAAARLEIRVSEISAIANGDTVSVEGVSYLITADPRVEDADRLVWVCDAAAVS